MNEKMIASRSLTVKYDNGETSTFEITIGFPYQNEEGEYCCEIHSENVLFSGVTKSFGVDAIDCLDYAIQSVDMMTTKFSKGRLFWPDGTSYKRIPATKKMGWG